MKKKLVKIINAQLDDEVLGFRDIFLRHIAERYKK